MDTSTAPADSIEWEEHQGKRVTIRAAAGSLAARDAARYLRPVEKMVDELVELLEPPKDKAAGRVEIYLLDPLPEIPAALTGDMGMGGDEAGMPPDMEDEEWDDEPGFGGPPGVGSNGVVHFTQAEEPPGAVGPALAEFLVRSWFGPSAAMAGALVEGVGALAAARAGAGPSVEEANAWVQAEVAAGRPVSVVGGGGDDDMEMATPPGAGGPPDMGAGGPEDEEDMDMSGMDPGMDGPPGMDGGDEVPPAASASFLAYLLASSDKGALHRFFEVYSPDSRDRASLEVFRQPLAALEEQWLQSVGGQKAPTLMAFLRYLTPLLKPHWIRYVESLIYMAISAMFGVAVPLLSGCVVDALASQGQPGPAPEAGGLCGAALPTLTSGRVVTLAVILLVAYVLEAGIENRRAWVEANMYNAIGVTMRERMFDHLLRLPQSFYAQARVGDISARLSGDLEQLQAGMQQLFSSGTFLLLTSGFAAGAALLKSWVVGIVILLIIPFFVFANKVLGSRIAKLSYEIQELDGQTASILQETLSAQQVVKAFGLETRVMSSYLGRLKALVRAAVRLMLTGHLYEGTVTFATTFAQLVVLAVGSVLVINGTIDEPGTLVALLLLLPTIIVPIRQLADMGEIVQGSSGSMARVRQILDEPVGIEDAPDAVELDRIEREITFEDVWFGYDPERTILKGLDLTIPHGKNVAIVGPSGSGKSTVINLLLRFYDPDEGTVSIDGHNLRQVSLTSLRRQIGIVFQETFVFNTTLRDNIALAKEGATDAEVAAAADQAQLQSLIESLPAGLDTVLGERGVRMSGGQRQRLAIARALIRDPAILIFDEATSALDARTEAEIRETISQVAAGRTTISITHRLGIAADADLVIVLDEGKVAEMGPHDELVTAGGLYQQLYEEQTGHAMTGAGRPRLGPEAARLKKVPIFSNIDPEVLADIADRLQLEKFAPGEDIVRQGQQGDKLYVITAGAAEVLVRDDRVERRVNTLKTGDYFGEYALLTGEERTATVRTTQPTDVYSLSKDDFTRLVESEPSLQQSLSAFVTQRKSAFAAAAAAAGIAEGAKA